MNMRLLLMAGAIAVLSACGSATDSVSFTAPPEFHSKASFGPFMQIWSKDDPHTVLILMALPVKTDLDKAMSEADLRDATIKKTDRIKICNGSQDALYAEVEGEAKTGSSDTSGKPQRSDVEFLATNVAGKTYMAMYARPLHTAADPAAEAAVKNVCPK